MNDVGVSSIQTVQIETAHEKGEREGGPEGD